MAAAPRPRATADLQRADGPDPPSDQQFTCSPASNCKPLVMRYAYSDQSLSPTRSDMAATLYNLTTTNDRFDDASLCYEFNGTTSLATVHQIADFPSPNFAVSFWAKSATVTHMQAVTIAAGSNVLASIEFNNQSGLAILWGSADTFAVGSYQPYLLTAGASGEFTDGAWHHYLVQFDGSKLSAFVDGAEVGSVAAHPLTGASDILIGGGDAPAWNGALDDVRLHTQSFDSSYVPQMVYSWAQVKPVTRNDSMLAYYPFDGDAVNNNGRGSMGRF